MAARFVGALVVVLGLAACGQEASPSVGVLTPTEQVVATRSIPTPPAPTETDPLTGIEWQLVEMIIAGRTVGVGDVVAVLRFDGAGGYSAKACNSTEGEAEIGDGTLLLTLGFTTEAFCSGLPGEIDDALNSLSGATATWTAHGDELVLVGDDGTTLRYRERTTIYPDDGGREVIAGERDGWQYRLSVASTDGKLSSMSFVSRSGPGAPWGEQSVGAPSPGESPLWTIVLSDLAGERLVAGFVPRDAVSATHQVTSDAPALALEIYDVDDAELAVTAGFVPDHSKDSIITVYDASGTVIAEWRHA